jgi:hypothetical protein
VTKVPISAAFVPPVSRQIASAGGGAERRPWKADTGRDNGRADEEITMQVKNWLKTVPTLAIIGSVLFLVLSVGSGLLMWGSSFAHNMVHTQLAEQRIAFPAKGSPGLDPKEFPGLQRYAGQAVDSGPKAKAYANEFIKAHLKSVANGQTYSQASTASRADPTNTELQGKVETLFRGETLRGLLLYAWGWSVVGAIAFWVGIGAMLGAIAVLLGLIVGFAAHRRQVRHTVPGVLPVTAAADRELVTV